MSNSAKIPRAQHFKWFQRIPSVQKPYARKKNFQFISHRKKVSWAISSDWRPSWILATKGRCHNKFREDQVFLVSKGIPEDMQ